MSSEEQVRQTKSNQIEQINSNQIASEEQVRQRQEMNAKQAQSDLTITQQLVSSCHCHCLSEALYSHHNTSACE